MDPFAAVARRYGLEVPSLYREMHREGRFDPRGNEETSVLLTDREWLSPDDIASYEFLDWQAPHKTWFVPFAISARRDEWGWRTDWRNGDDVPVVFCSRGPEGFGYAPHFEGFLYRALLEEFAGTWLMESADDERGRRQLLHTVELVAPRLRTRWAKRLRKLAKLDWQKEPDGTICVYPHSECQAIVEDELAFPHLGEEFLQEEYEAKPGKKSAAKKTATTAKTSRATAGKGGASSPSSRKRKKKSGGDPAPAPVVIPGADPSGFAGSRAGQTRADNGPKMELAWCPPGTFRMGSPPDEPGHDADEGPVDVTLSHGFWLGRFEVTQAEYEAIAGTNPSHHRPDGSRAREVAGLDTRRFPVECVSWLMAVEFCRLFTAQEREARRLPGNWEYRLPAEAQWEYACRAGTPTATAFGHSLSSLEANFDGTSPYHEAAAGPKLERTAAVGSYPANAWGFHDMHGNVKEWCRDGKTDRLPGGIDPEAPLPRGMLQRVVRGGGWRSKGFECRSAFRYGMVQTVWDDPLGFRVALVRIA